MTRRILLALVGLILCLIGVQPTASEALAATSVPLVTDADDNYPGAAHLTGAGPESEPPASVIASRTAPRDQGLLGECRAPTRPGIDGAIGETIYDRLMLVAQVDAGSSTSARLGAMAGEVPPPVAGAGVAAKGAAVR